MRKLNLAVVAFILCILLLWAGVAVGALNKQSIVGQKKIEPDTLVNIRDNADDFYFVQITDTHVMHKLFDPDGISTNIFKTVIETVTSLSEKPAFIVITGDLVEWGGSRWSGALNFQAFLDYLYEKDDQLYADEEYSIPVYTIPGNHDYRWDTTLTNYYLYVDKIHNADDARYIITHQDASLFFLDSGHDYILEPWDWMRVLGSGLYDDDIAWLENALNDCNSQHKIVLMHHPAVNYRDKYSKMTDVIARNREVFLELCEDYDVDLVLVGHTHQAVVFDGEEEVYNETALPLNCSLYPTLYVQSDDCKDGCHYRNISIVGNDIWLDACAEIEVTSVNYEYAKEIAKFPIVRSFKEMSIEKQEAVYISQDEVMARILLPVTIQSQ